jgi:hypothetical protein
MEAYHMSTYNPPKYLDHKIHNMIVSKFTLSFSCGDLRLYSYRMFISLVNLFAF